MTQLDLGSVTVEDVVAVRVALSDGASRYFVTWGRTQDPVDPRPVEEVVLRFANSCSLGASPVTAHLSATLRKAAESREAPYFFEAMLAFAADRQSEPDDRRRAERDEAMHAGRESYYCGRPFVSTSS